MKPIKHFFFLMLLVSVVFPGICFAKLDIAPQTQEALMGILQGLANDHAYKQWCENHCGQIHEMEFTGTIASGSLNVTIKGHIIGKHNGVLPLFGAVPSIEITSLTNAGVAVPLVYHNKAYYTFLAPGPFQLSGQISIDPHASTNVTLPGPVGQVLLNISDQERLLGETKFGQWGGSFGIVSAQANPQQDKTSSPEQSLRLKINKDFKIARDKSFVYTIDVIGATSGQVITIPLEHGEKVIATTPKNAKVGDSQVAFTAMTSDARFVIQGEWTKNSIELTAKKGATQETWSLGCLGAYDCGFTSDAEKSITATGHEWFPLGGQKLGVTWKELGLLKGQSKVAQTVVLDSIQTGDGLKQTLTADIDSSEATPLYLDLPKGARPTELAYDNVPSTILKNNEGLIHLSLPKGSSQLGLKWFFPKAISHKIPIPDIKECPVAKWFFWVTPNEHESVILAGGPDGSPVILFWPRLGFCLLVGLLFLFTEKKLTKTVTTKALFFLVMCSGWALSTPASILCILGLIVFIRWVPRVQSQRNIFGLGLEILILLGLIVTTISSYLFILNKAFFSNNPLTYETFCSTRSPLFGLNQVANFCWEVALTQPEQTLKSPYLLTVPTLAIRIVYFVWAIVVGFFLFGELKNLLPGLKHYFGLGTKPLFKRKPKKNDASAT